MDEWKTSIRVDSLKMLKYNKNIPLFSNNENQVVSTRIGGPHILLSAQKGGRPQTPSAKYKNDYLVKENIVFNAPSCGLKNG